MQRNMFLSLTAVCLFGATQVTAGVFQNIFRVLDIAATPSGAPVLTTGDGTRINGLRSGRLRILPDQLGDGYSLEFDRNFGPDSQGRPETFDLGPLDLTLSGQTQMTAGFTSRGFLIGNLNMNANNLNYTLRGRSGAQNSTLSGTLNVANQVEINQFGFYTLSMNVSNTVSQLTVDGVVTDLEQIETNFDVGPIFVEGNIFADMLAGIIAGVGGDTSLLAELFPRSSIPDLTASIQDAFLKDDVVSGLLLSDADFEFVSSGTAVLGAAFPAQDAGFGAIGSIGAELPSGITQPQLLPEPATFALLLMGAALYARRR